MASAWTQRLRIERTCACLEAGSWLNASRAVLRGILAVSAGVETKHPGRLLAWLVFVVACSRFLGYGARLSRRRTTAGRPRVPLLVVGGGALPVRHHARNPAAHRARAAEARGLRAATTGVVEASDRARRARPRSDLPRGVRRTSACCRCSATGAPPTSKGSCPTAGTRAEPERSWRSSSS